jgi:hypothetical protein
LIKEEGTIKSCLVHATSEKEDLLKKSYYLGQCPGIDNTIKEVHEWL